jgi:FkbM family methyltransferase
VLKKYKFPISHKLISLLRDIDIRGIRKLSVVLPRVLLPDSTKIGAHILQTNDGFLMKIDPSKDAGVELSLFQTGTYEKGTLYFITSCLNRGDCFIDIGANIGLMSIFASQCVGNSGKILAFEAHPETHELLQENIALNHIENIDTFNFALGNETGKATIYDNWNVNRGGASLVIHAENSTGFEVDVKTLDEVIQNDFQPKMIKIDVEGFEFQVLKGATNTIKNCKPILIIEFSVSRENQYDPFEMIDFIESFGFYEIFKLSGTKERKSKLIQINSREEFPNHDNIFCIPKV